MRKPKRPRTARRVSQRKLDKLVRDREKLASLEPGGSPERPLEVTTASLVEPRALAHRCLRCDNASRLVDHDAVLHDDRLLRVVTLRCDRCSAERTLYFRVVAALLN